MKEHHKRRLLGCSVCVMLSVVLSVIGCKTPAKSGIGETEDLKSNVSVSRTKKGTQLASGRRLWAWRMTGSPKYFDEEQYGESTSGISQSYVTAVFEEQPGNDEAGKGADKSWIQQEERNGLWITTSSGLWELRETPVEVHRSTCTCRQRLLSEYQGDQESTCDEVMTKTATSFVNEQTNMEHWLVKPEVALPKDDNAMVSTTVVTILGSYGNLVFYTICDGLHGCGNHGSIACHFHLLNLETGVIGDLEPFKRPLDRERLAKLGNRWREKHVGNRASNPISRNKILGVGSVQPFWNREGNPELLVRIEYACDYASSDPTWTSNTCSFDQVEPVDWLPAQMREGLDGVPKEVVSFWGDTFASGKSLIR